MPRRLDRESGCRAAGSGGKLTVQRTIRHPLHSGLCAGQRCQADLLATCGPTTGLNGACVGKIVTLDGQQDARDARFQASGSPHRRGPGVVASCFL